NLYVYVGNDSVNRADPSGLWGFAFGLGAGAGLGFPLGFGAEAGVGIALDYTPGQGITAAVYKSTAGYGGAGVFGGAGVDLSFFSNIENFAGTAVEGKIDLGLLGQGGIDVGRPLSGKAGSAGVLTATLGVGAGLFVGLGLSSTE